MRRTIPTLLLFALACAPTPAANAEADFSKHWHDGRAELDGYRYGVTRYGEPRTGEAVMVFVTEPFSESKRVKVDDASANPSDTFDALKLNLVRDFTTGIYDYNTMVSLFTRSESFEPVKISFSSAEWCGHVYEELVFREIGIEDAYYSYFENESARRTIPPRPGGIAEDNLFILLRGLRGPFLAPGAKRSIDLLPSSFYSRLVHRPVDWQTAELEHRAASERITVPAGTFDARVYTVRTPDRRGTFHVEAAYPHRIVRWEWKPSGSRGLEELGELTGTERLAYWQLNANGDESYRKALGLSER